MSEFLDMLRREDEAERAARVRKWDARFMQVAADVASWSKDPGHQVGAVLTDADTLTIISAGFNGFPRRLLDSNLNARARKLSRTVHAEVNCILNARGPLAFGRLTMYVHGLPPCEHCAAVIIQAGVQRVVIGGVELDHSAPPSEWKESGARALCMFEEAGLAVDVLR